VTSRATASPRVRGRWPLGRRRIARRAQLSRFEREALGIIGLGLLLGLWQILASTGHINPLIFSSPRGIVQSIQYLYDNHKLFGPVWSTTKLFAVSVGIAIVIGIPVGIALGWYKRLNAFFDPWLSMFYAMPRFALLPLVIAIAGIGFTSRVLLVCTIALPPILINTATGVSTIDRDHFRLARSCLATNVDLLRTVALPGAIPTIVAGVRQGILYGLLGVVVAEYFVGTTGIGGMIFTSGITLRNGDALVGALILGLAAIVLTGGLRKLEKRLDRWRV